MSLDKAIPAPPKGKLVAWIGFISLILTAAFMIDHYWGDGNLFGLAKKKETAKTDDQKV